MYGTDPDHTQRIRIQAVVRCLDYLSILVHRYMSWLSRKKNEMVTLQSGKVKVKSAYGPQSAHHITINSFL